jgi:hypothetical protein
MTAREALRKARATMRCERGPWPYASRTCDLVGRLVERGYRSAQHTEHASALLDGFSVEEVTAAEAARTTEPRP